MEDVNHVHSHGFDFVLFLQAAGDFARNRLQLRLRRGRTNDEEIGKGRDPAQIEDDDVFRLFVGGKLRAGRS
jgi:hypothetical protein